MIPEQNKDSNQGLYQELRVKANLHELGVTEFFDAPHCVAELSLWVETVCPELVDGEQAIEVRRLYR